MEPERFQQLREVFERLVHLPPDVQKLQLDGLVSGAEEREFVEALLSGAKVPGSSALVSTQTAGFGALPPIMPNQVLAGRYRIVRRLGVGGFAQAFLVEDKGMHDKEVVAKLPSRERKKTGEWFDRHFVGEIRALAALNHPGIVQVFEAEQDTVYGDFFTVQFIDGPTLGCLIRKAPIGMERSAAILGNMARALAAAHAKGIIHRDLKPDNVIVRMAETAEEVPVLIDFGIASLVEPDGKTISTRVAGTPKYMAPEQFEGKAVPQSDLYALGLIALELLTGTANERSPAAGLRLLREKAPRIAAADRQPIIRLLSLNPAERGKAAEYAEFFHRLARQQTTRRNWLLTSGAVACAAVVAVGFRRASAEVLRLSIKLVRIRAGTTELISPVDGVVVQNDKLRLEVEASPPAYCYVFGQSLAGILGKPPRELNLLFPPQPQKQPTAQFTAPSTAVDWIEVDNELELVSLVFIASLTAVAEADRAVAAVGPNGTVNDAAIRGALEDWIRRSRTVQWAKEAGGAWVAASDQPAISAVCRLQHMTV